MHICIRKPLFRVNRSPVETVYTSTRIIFVDFCQLTWLRWLCWRVCVSRMHPRVKPTKFAWPANLRYMSGKISEAVTSSCATASVIKYIYILPEIQFITSANLYQSLKSILYRKALVSMSCSMFIDSHLLRRLIKLFKCLITLFCTKWLGLWIFFCNMTCLFILFSILKERNSTATRQL